MTKIHKIKWRGLSLIIVGIILIVIANKDIKIFLLNDTILYIFGFIGVFLGMIFCMYYNNKGEILLNRKKV